MIIVIEFVLYAATFVYCDVALAKTNIDGALSTLWKAKAILAHAVEKPESIGFHAGLSTDVTIGPSHTVKFDKVITNIGDAYNPKTGQFTAPYDGMYFFASSFETAGNNELHLAMIMQDNSNIITQGHATFGTYKSGSMSAVVYLKKGTIVQVIHLPYLLAPQMISQSWSWFNGYLIN